MIEAQERLLLNQRALDALKARIRNESYLDVKTVASRLNVTRAIVEALPMEVLPYVPYGTGSRVYRRYHPADVLAADARIRGWERAKREGKGADKRYLATLRAELDAQDEAAIELARSMKRSA